MLWTISYSSLVTNLAKYLDQICRITDLSFFAGFVSWFCNTVPLMRHTVCPYRPSLISTVARRADPGPGSLLTRMLSDLLISSSLMRPLIINLKRNFLITHHRFAH